MRLPAAILTSIAKALQKPARPRSFPYSVWGSILASGWGQRSQIEDLLLAMDDRVYDLPLEELAKYADYPMTWVSSRPRFQNSELTMSKAMAVRDVAGFCIFLENLGFAVDPAPMVTALIDSLATLPMMTASESDIFTYSYWRHKRKLILQASDSPDGYVDQKDWRGVNRIRYSCITRGNQAAMLTVTPPNWRQPKRTEVTCDICKHPYTQGDRESVLNHRTHHARVVRLLSPRPSKKMRERLALGASAERVDVNAPLWIHREVYERALRFKRDFQYDFIQWHSARQRAELDPRWVGFVFSTPEGAIDGACAFQHGDDGWSLGWVWIRPERRRSGVLSARWPGFVAEFGDFWIEHPLSAAMHEFIARHATPGQRALIANRYPGGSPLEHAVG